MNEVKRRVHVEVKTEGLGACEEFLLKRILLDALEVWVDCVEAESVGE